jgi:hypothetical protein
MALSARNSKSGKPGSRIRKPALEFPSLHKLKTATLEWCAAEVNRLSGPPPDRWPDWPGWWNEREAAHLSESITVSDDAREICNDLRRILVKADDFLRGHPKANDGYVDELRRNVAACQWSLSLGRSGPDGEWTPRTYLVAEYGRSREWWWHDRDPRVRDLAILSLLAGNFPDLRRQLSEHGLTVEDAVRAEERAIGQAWRRFREAQATTR